ncbi:MAG: OsmC family protein [Anaerosomatales bacterium]|nr:OsmC family protein [Anaerosomatales bacterium]MDT8433577.1 OsmC family protein [Anaerosomatales bacterium]
MDTVRVRWSENRQLIGWDEAGHGIVMDASPAYHGEGTGIRPIELVLYGIAGCTAMDVISILEKKRQDVRGVEVVVEGDQRTDEYPKVYTEIRLHYIVTGFGVSEEAVRRSIELSEEKYCSVGGMLKPHVRIATSYEVREARQANTPSR